MIPTLADINLISIHHTQAVANNIDKVTSSFEKAIGGFVQNTS